MTDQIASHSEEVKDETALPQAEENPVKDAFLAFGLEAEYEEESKEDDEPPKEEVPPTEPEPERKGITVKYNKENVFIDEDKVPEYARKGLNYDKVEGRAKELQDALDRTARLNGYKDHAEYVANLDKIEQEREQAKEREFEALEKSLFDELVDNGLDEQKAREYIDKHPLLAEARALKAERSEQQEKQQQQSAEDQWTAKWNTFYEAYPDLIESAAAFSEGSSPDWYTPEMQSRIERGYDPIDAYELAHKSTIMQQTARKAEQKSIKDQMLGKRSQVLTDTAPNDEPEVSPALASAFSMFGLNPEKAKKYAKK